MTALHYIIQSYLFKDLQNKFSIQCKKETMKSQLTSILVFCLSLAAADDAGLQEFTTANNLFAQNVYKQLSKSSEGNFLVSPFSAETVLAFAQSGSKGETAQELRTALHLPDDKVKVESALKSLIPKFKDNGLYTLHTANKLYVKKGFPIKEEFKDAASQVYHADSDTIDFAKNVDAASIMNDWVEKHTNSKIKNLIISDDLDADTRAVLINALYFQANWSNPFPLKATSKWIFYKTATEVVEVDSLTQWGKSFNYYECPHLKAQFLELPFKGGEASMVIVLPNELNGLASLENQLDQVFKPQHNLTSESLYVVLPKFEIESLIDFRNVLEKLGVKKIFDEREADLSGIGGNKGDLIIGKVEQKTFIKVSEEGVEAAAATYVKEGRSNGIHNPKYFVADHPFIFYIKAKGLIIFAGRVTDPAKH